MALNFNSTPKPEEIGIGVLAVQDINEMRTEKKAKLYSQETGDFVGEVDILVSSMKAKKAANIKEVSTRQNLVFVWFFHYPTSLFHALSYDIIACRINGFYCV